MVHYVFLTEDAMTYLWILSSSSCGGLQSHKLIFPGISEPWLLGQQQAGSQGDGNMLSWLYNEELLSTVTSVMSDLQAAMNQSNEQGKDEKQ